MDGVLGTAGAMAKVCADPSAGPHSTPAATWAVSEQVPVPAKLTVRPSAPTVHLDGELVLTEVIPSPVVVTLATKLPPKGAEVGSFEIDGALGVPLSTEKLWAEPVAAA